MCSLLVWNGKEIQTQCQRDDKTICWARQNFLAFPWEHPQLIPSSLTVHLFGTTPPFHRSQTPAISADPTNSGESDACGGWSKCPTWRRPRSLVEWTLEPGARSPGCRQAGPCHTPGTSTGAPSRAHLEGRLPKLSFGIFLSLGLLTSEKIQDSLGEGIVPSIPPGWTVLSSLTLRTSRTGEDSEGSPTRLWEPGKEPHEGGEAPRV